MRDWQLIVTATVLGAVATVLVAYAWVLMLTT